MRLSEFISLSLKLNHFLSLGCQPVLILFHNAPFNWVKVYSNNTVNILHQELHTWACIIRCTGALCTFSECGVYSLIPCLLLLLLLFIITFLTLRGSHTHTPMLTVISPVELSRWRSMFFLCLRVIRRLIKLMMKYYKL